MGSINNAAKKTVGHSKLKLLLIWIFFEVMMSKIYLFNNRVEMVQQVPWGEKVTQENQDLMVELENP